MKININIKRGIFSMLFLSTLLLTGCNNSKVGMLAPGTSTSMEPVIFSNEGPLMDDQMAYKEDLPEARLNYLLRVLPKTHRNYLLNNISEARYYFKDYPKEYSDWLGRLDLKTFKKEVRERVKWRQYYGNVFKPLSEEEVDKMVKDRQHPVSLRSRLGFGLSSMKKIGGGFYELLRFSWNRLSSWKNLMCKCYSRLADI